VVIAA